MPARPLSPHLSVYRFAYTMAMSISHRISGIALSVGLLALAAWLLSAAAGADSYAQTVAVLSTWFFKLVLLALLAAFAYHTCAGIRHLLWDTGRGLERAQARRSARIVLGVAVIAFAWCAWALFVRGGGAS
jgi:succinate dehydrogenase / fumarate reductase cytochrome b subunit